MMATGHQEVHALFSLGNVHAFHLQDGEETPLTPMGAQTLSLLMVPTTSPFEESSSGLNDAAAAAAAGREEQDFYLHLHLPPDLDLSLPATTQVFHQPPNSYIIPRWDLGPEAGALTRIDFPPIGKGPDHVTQDDIDTFETILAQCTSFMERAHAPAASVGGQPPKYDPRDYAPGEGYIGTGSEPGHGHIVLIDEDDGSIVGELSQGFELQPGADVKPGSKRPVEISLPQEGQAQTIVVHEVSEDYLRMARHPSYKNSSIVQNAATASRLIVMGSDYVSHGLSSGAEAFRQRTKPSQKPLHFSAATQDRVRKLNNLTHGAVSLSAATVGQVGRFAQNVGARVAGRGGKTANSNKNGKAASYEPGILNKSLIAFSTIADGIEQGARQILATGAGAASTVVHHRYGPEAGQIAGHLVGGVKNVGLVYVDATGVTRRAVLKSVAKGMVVGRMPNGDEVVVGDGDGGVVPPEMAAAANGHDNKVIANQSTGMNSKLGFAAGADAGMSGPPPGYDKSSRQQGRADEKRSWG